jgi:vancomycin aglycone glucosyltransferase
MRVLLSTYGSPGSQGSRWDVDPMMGLAVRLALQVRALQALGAEMPVCAPPDFAGLLARVGLPLVAGNTSMMPALLSRAGRGAGIGPAPRSGSIP